MYHIVANVSFYKLTGVVTCLTLGLILNHLYFITMSIYVTIMLYTNVVLCNIYCMNISFTHHVCFITT